MEKQRGSLGGRVLEGKGEIKENDDGNSGHYVGTATLVPTTFIPF